MQAGMGTAVISGVADHPELGVEATQILKKRDRSR
jgi:hypothetical protein